jgi:hypothetical protein
MKKSIKSRITTNHNQTLVGRSIKSRLAGNHNQTLIVK